MGLTSLDPTPFTDACRYIPFEGDRYHCDVYYLHQASLGLELPSMSNEIVQPTEQDLSRSTSTEGGKASKPPALDTSSFRIAPIQQIQTTRLCLQTRSQKFLR